jgi:hypothetical protein
MIDAGSKLFALGATLMPFGSIIAAAPDSVQSAAASPAVPGWTEFLDGLRDLPDRVLARLPPEQRNDPQIQEEVGRLALSAVTAAAIDALASDPDHPVFIPQINNYITLGQPNADTNYRSAKIAPGGSYRLRGRRGSMSQVRVAEVGPRPKQTDGAHLGAPRPVHDLNELTVDAEGRYDVVLSPARPNGYSGSWWQLDPTTDTLLVRMVGSDWDKELEPTLSIERLDVPASRPRLPAKALEQKLRSIPAAADFIAPLLVDRPEKLRTEGYLNKLKEVDLSRMGGLAGQFYYEGAYALKDDEALILETSVPEKCAYRSLILTNEVYQTTDWYNNNSSLNGAQAPADNDGILRIVVSARDPGVPNWLDTAGYQTGVIQGRWLDCSSQPVPSVKKVLLKDVRKSLPAATPEISAKERDEQVRDRRAALQQRPLW